MELLFARPGHLGSLCSVLIKFSASNICFIISSYLIFYQCYSLKANRVRSPVLLYILDFCISWRKIWQGSIMCVSDSCVLASILTRL